MKFKALLAATAVAAASLATPAHAHHPETAPKIIDALTALGVRVNAKSRWCPSTNAVRSPAGTYNARTNTICVRHWNLIGSEAWYRTLVHEAWHAVQDGLEGMGNAQMSAFSSVAWDHLGEAEARAWIRRLKRANTYTTHDWANRYSDMQHSTRDKFLEWEAVMTEAHPDMVLHGLRMLCKHDPACY